MTIDDEINCFWKQYAAQIALREDELIMPTEPILRTPKDVIEYFKQRRANLNEDFQRKCLELEYWRIQELRYLDDEETAKLSALREYLENSNDLTTINVDDPPNTEKPTIHLTEADNEWIYSVDIAYIDINLATGEVPNEWTPVKLDDSVDSVDSIFWPMHSASWLNTKPPKIYFSSNQCLTFEPSLIPVWLYEFVHQRTKRLFVWRQMARLHRFLAFLAKVREKLL